MNKNEIKGQLFDDDSVWDCFLWAFQIIDQAVAKQ